MNHSKPIILYFCEHTSKTSTRSGIQRVVIETALAISKFAQLNFVKWDEIDGQLRHFDTRDIEALFGPRYSHHFQPHKACQKIDYRFDETITKPDQTWLLFPEIPYFLPNGENHFNAIITQCKEYGIRTAAIFYDLIPIHEPAYKSGKIDHISYVIDLLRCDKIFAISKFSSDDLKKYITDAADINESLSKSLKSKIVPIPLGEFREGDSWGSKVLSKKSSTPLMVLVGTIEPRKQQTRLLKVLNDARIRSPELSKLQVEIFGSLHPQSADEFYLELSKNSNIKYHEYAPDEVINSAYARAWFSAFVSNHEGYGLPIVESLKHNIPCITASFGAMSEIAKDGGCLTINVNNDLEIENALKNLINDEKLLLDLQAEITKRPKRSWVDYSHDIASSIGEAIEFDLNSEKNFRTEILEKLFVENYSEIFIGLYETSWTISFDQCKTTLDTKNLDRGTGKYGLISIINIPTIDALEYQKKISILKSDVIICKNPSALKSIIDTANKLDFDEPITNNIFSDHNAIECGIDCAISLSKKRKIAQQIALDSMIRQAMIASFQKHILNPEYELAIVISTYNRADFVEANVNWILNQIDDGNFPAKCIVIDNASTDGTNTRLKKYSSHPKFLFIENANNVGMLGNLRVCSAGLYAPYVWVTGDDDYIIPGAIERTIDAIRENRGIPLLIHNFGVYHRDAYRNTDNPEKFIQEIIKLAPAAKPEGTYKINSIAEEHDNLFTAVYPIVFRSDVLSACFNFPFTGTPFSNLVESVPTTKIILESYKYSDAYWFSDTGIVGNAHNSWTGHRPRWHLVLMPRVLQLARESGVNPKKIWQWMKIHRKLFDEASQIAVLNGSKANIQLPLDTNEAEINFRQKIELDPNLNLGITSPYATWNQDN